MSDTTNATGYFGQWTPSDDATEFNKQSFLVRQLLGLISTATEVKVVAVSSPGGVAPVGYVDVQPLVNLIDGMGNSSPHGVVHNLPYIRLQGGENAVICDPVIGDIGVAIFADRDISSVKANKGQANPGSRRRFNMSDGIYLGGNLNGTPKQYVCFTATGILITDKNGNIWEMKDGSIEVTTPIFKVNGDIQATGNVTAGQDGTYVELLHHVHTESGGEGDGGPPVGNS